MKAGYEYPKLRDCQCGKPPKWEKHHFESSFTHRNYFTRISIRCLNCGVSVTPRGVPSPHGGHPVDHSPDLKAGQGVINQMARLWNHRPAEESLRKRVGELEELLLEASQCLHPGSPANLSRLMLFKVQETLKEAMK